VQDINRRTARDSDNPGHPIPTSSYIYNPLNGRLKSPADTDPRLRSASAVKQLPMSLHTIHEAACSRFCRCRIPTDPPSAPLLCCRWVTTKAPSRQRHSSMLRPGVITRRRATTSSIATKRSSEQMVWSRNWKRRRRKYRSWRRRPLGLLQLSTTTCRTEHIYKCQLEEARSCSPNTSTSPSAPVAWLFIDDHIDSGPLRKNRPMHLRTASMFCSEISLRWLVGGQTTSPILIPA
jgi:hypothetical protein